MGNQYTEDID